MAILAGLLSLATRFVGRLLSAALGWAGTLLFGRLPKQRELLMAMTSLFALGWVAAVVGIAWPNVGAMLLAFVPLSSQVPMWLARLLMLVIALLLPLVVGGALAFGMERDGGRRSPGAWALAVARGYLVTPALAGTLAWLAVYASYRRILLAVRRWTELHVPLEIPNGDYDTVAREVGGSLEENGIVAQSGVAPPALAIPARLLARAAGRSDLGPDRIAVFRAAEVEVTVHPFDLAIAGTALMAARARAAAALRLVGSPAHFTMEPRGQALEDVLERVLTDRPGPAARAAAFAAADRRLSTEAFDAADWDILARVRYQVEHDVDHPGAADTLPGAGRPVAYSGGAAGTGHGASAHARSEAILALVAIAITAANALLVLGSAIPRGSRRGRPRGR